MTSFALILSSGLLLLPVLLAQPLSVPPAPARFLRKKFATIHGRRMAYVDVGSGNPIVFLHGNPTSSFLWRNVMPLVEGRGRLIAPDLIGMGDSEKLPPSDPSRYTVRQHANFVFALLEHLGVKKDVILVLHDWGSTLGFQWAFERRGDRNAVRGIAHMESLVRTFSAEDLTGDFEFFVPIRTPRIGERLILRDNFFIEVTLPSLILRNLTRAEMAEYRRPFLRPGEDRRATLTFPRQIPFDGQPPDVARMIARHSRWLRRTRVPKLLILGNPGAIITGADARMAASFPNTKVTTVRGLHFLQEDSPRQIGRALAQWIDEL